MHWLRWVAIAVLLVFVGRGIVPAIFERRTPLAVPTSAAISVDGSGVDWPIVGGDIGAARRTTASAVLARTGWTMEAGAAVTVPAIADDQHLYLGLQDDRLIAVSLRDGTVSWTYQAPHWIWSAPTVAGERLFLGLSSGLVVAIDARTGIDLWQTQIDDLLLYPVTVVDGVVMVTVPNGIVGLEADTGRTLWQVGRDPAPSHASVVVVGGHLVLPAHEYVRVYDRVTGAETFRFPNPMDAQLASFDGRLVHTVSSCVVTAVDIRSTTPWWEGQRRLLSQLFILGVGSPPPSWALWSALIGRCDRASLARLVFPPALDGRGLVVADERGSLGLYAPETGALRWEIQIGPLAGAPTLTPEGVLVVAVGGLSLRRIEDGSELAQVVLPEAARREALVTAHGTFVIDRGGSVRALRR